MINNLTELVRGETQKVEVLVKDITNTACKNGSFCQRITVRDMQEHEVVFMNFGENVNFTANTIVDFTVETKEYKGKDVHNIIKYEIAEKQNPLNYLPKAHISIHDEWEKFLEYYKSIEKPGLKKLVGQIISENKKAFAAKPLHAEGPFSRIGGILEATVQLLRLASCSVETLGLNRDLTIASAILYYIGNIDLTNQTFVASEDDVLIGESLSIAKKIFIAEMKIRTDEDPVTEEMLTENEVKMIVHIVSSRFSGNYSAIPEAHALRYLDKIVQKNDEIKELIKDAAPGDIVNGQGKQRFYRFEDVPAATEES